jgi:hypothetical protein
VPALQPENVSVVVSAKPLRPLPDNKIAYNFTRIALVSGIGLATILAFVSVVFVLRKKRKNQTGDAHQAAADFAGESPREKALLDDRYKFDDEDDEDENLS